MRKSLGFTLIELMITLVIVGIVIAIAAPSFTSVIQNNRVTTESNRLITTLKLARSEAIRRGVYVSVCRTSSSTTCDGGTGTLLVFSDTATTNTATPEVGEIIKVLDGSPTDVTVTPTSGPVFFRYMGNGRLATAATTIKVLITGCPTGEPKAKEITIGQDGHATIKKTTC
jgi:type IV fimbrial biogenesis protein FimT